MHFWRNLRSEYYPLERRVSFDTNVSCRTKTVRTYGIKEWYYFSDVNSTSLLYMNNVKAVQHSPNAVLYIF